MAAPSRDPAASIQVSASSDAAPLDIWHESFPELARSHGLSLGSLPTATVEESETGAALFAFQLLLRERAIRKQFRGSLTGPQSRFAQWISGPGAVGLGLSVKAQAMIQRAFAQPQGEHVYQVYLNNPELQGTYRLGLLPAGQAHFLAWLTTHGKRDHRITEVDVLWFLVRSRDQVGRGLALTYLLQPVWQQQHPNGLTDQGWQRLCQWYREAYPQPEEDGDPFAAPPQLIEMATVDAGRKDRLIGVNVISHFCNPSGIQQAAVWTKTALERAGLRTSCRDVPVPRHVVPTDREQWLGLEIFPVTILTHAATPFFASGYERAGLLPGENVYRIAYWAWELEAVPDDWVKAAELVDEIWAPTEFVAEAMRRRMPCPVFRMPPGVEIGPIEPIARGELGLPEDHFIFLFMFDLHSQMHRKNPVGVFEAFREAFRDDDKATLVIKCTGGDIHGGDLAILGETIRGRNVILLDRLMTRAQAYGLIGMSDCFVSLHRSEGFGLGLAEAMLLGKPVIATGYSGNLDFMTRENSYLVDYEMVEITEDRPIYTRGNIWAEPSIPHASALMRQVYDRPAEARARARCVRPEIQQLLSLEAAGRRMRSRLEQILAR